MNLVYRLHSDYVVGYILCKDKLKEQGSVEMAKLILKVAVWSFNIHIQS